MSCKDCTKRVLYCHSTCPEYLAFVEKNAELKAKKLLENEVHDYILTTAKMNREKRERKQNLPNKNYRKRGVS